MLIKRLTVHNFGVYAGTNTFEFFSDRPVSLIGGMNGRGKTTFLEAVLIALYGSNAFSFRESKYNTYGQYLRAFVNTKDGSKEAYVELELSLEDGKDDRYLIRREWNSKKLRVSEDSFVFKNGEFSVFLTENWAMFIENVLPSGLSSFFFFDGEKIAELAAEETNAHMKESIKALLGISVLDSLENDIRKVTKKINKSKESSDSAEQMEMLRNNKDKAERALTDCDENIAELTEKLGELNRKLDTVKTEYSKKGGDVYTQRQELFEKRAELNIKKNQQIESLYNKAAGEAPLYLVRSLIKKIRRQADQEHESKALNIVVSKVAEAYKKYSKNTIPRNIEVVSDFVDFINNESEKNRTEEIYDLSDQGLYQIKNLAEGQLKKTHDDILSLISELNAIQEKIDEMDRFLSVEIDESALPGIYKKMKTLEQKVIEVEVARDGEIARRSGLNGAVMKASVEYKRFVENYLEQIEVIDEGERVQKYAYQAEQILKEYRIRLQKTKISKLASTMTDCYKRLASKSNLIKCISINGETLDIDYIGVDGISIPKASLSAGEKQLMVVSLLWALAICSKRRLPVIIDTPLSRLDSNHRVALIKTYFPNASAQTIILSTDSEIDRGYYELMRDSVGDKFTLIYDDQDRCSTIERGYFDYD